MNNVTHTTQHTLVVKYQTKFCLSRSFWEKNMYRNYLLGGAGGIVVVHVSLTTVTRVRIRFCAVIGLKLSLSYERRVLCSSTLPSITGFHGYPSVSLDRWGVALTGPLGRTAQVADTVIQYNKRYFTLLYLNLTFTLI